MSRLEAMRHEPVADRLGIRTHKLPPDWRQRGGGGGKPPRRPSGSGSGCSTGVLALLALVVAALAVWAVTGDG